LNRNSARIPRMAMRGASTPGLKPVKKSLTRPVTG
jgi:hypothetical protein